MFSSTQVRQEDLVFKVSINYFVSLRPAQDTRDSLSKQTKARTKTRKKTTFVDMPRPCMPRTGLPLNFILVPQGFLGPFGNGIFITVWSGSCGLGR